MHFKRSAGAMLMPNLTWEPVVQRTQGSFIVPNPFSSMRFLHPSYLHREEENGEGRLKGKQRKVESILESEGSGFQSELLPVLMQVI